MMDLGTRVLPWFKKYWSLRCEHLSATINKHIDEHGRFKGYVMSPPVYVGPMPTRQEIEVPVPICTCPTECDCERPDPKDGEVGLYPLTERSEGRDSESCPIHNLVPLAADDCMAVTHRPNEAWPTWPKIPGDLGPM